MENTNTAVASVVDMKKLTAMVHTVATESGVYINWKETVLIPESSAGLIGVSFHTPANNTSDTLLAFTTLIFKGMVMTGFSLRELTSKKGTKWTALMAPSRSYKDAKGVTQYSTLTGFTKSLGDRITDEVVAAFSNR